MSFSFVAFSWTRLPCYWNTIDEAAGYNLANFELRNLSNNNGIGGGAQTKSTASGGRLADEPEHVRSGEGASSRPVDDPRSDGTMRVGTDAPNSKVFRSGEGPKEYWDEYYSLVGREAEDFSSLSQAAQKRGINVVEGNYSSYRKNTIQTGPDTKRWEFIEEFLHHKVATEGAFKPARDVLKKELKLNRVKQIGRVSEEIAVKQWILSKPKLLKVDQPTQTVLQKQIDQLKKHGVSDGY
jgi:hypothetical protein